MVEAKSHGTGSRVISTRFRIVSVMFKFERSPTLLTVNTRSVDAQLTRECINGHSALLAVTSYLRWRQCDVTQFQQLIGIAAG
jgi:hypothetical protein